MRVCTIVVGLGVLVLLYMLVSGSLVEGVADCPCDQGICYGWPMLSSPKAICLNRAKNWWESQTSISARTCTNFYDGKIC